MRKLTFTVLVIMALVLTAHGAFAAVASESSADTFRTPGGATARVLSAVPGQVTVEAVGVGGIQNTITFVGPVVVEKDAIGVLIDVVLLIIDKVVNAPPQSCTTTVTVTKDENGNVTSTTISTTCAPA